MRFLSVFFVSVLFFLLVGCGGGGGGGANTTPSSTPITVTPLTTTWIAAQAANTQVTANGISISSTYSAPTPSNIVASVTNNGFDTNAQGAITYNSSGDISGISVTYNGMTHNWQQGGSTYVSPSDSTVGVSAVGHTTRGLFSNPTSDSSVWNYQAYGYWLTGYGTGGGQLGAKSYGIETVGASIPTSGTASFSGYSSGTYIDSSGELHTVRAEFSATANFASRQVSISTTDTWVKDLSTSTLQSKSSLNMSGNMVYSTATNNLISSSLSTNSGLTGDAQAQFYGPNAEEFGGVFSVSNGGLEAYQGAFGAKQ